MVFALAPTRGSTCWLKIESHDSDYSVSQNELVIQCHMYENACLHSLHISQEDIVFCLSVELTAKDIGYVDLCFATK